MILLVLTGVALVGYAISVILTIMLSLAILAAHKDKAGIEDGEYDKILVSGFVRPWMWVVFAFTFARGFVRGYRGDA